MMAEYISREAAINAAIYTSPMMPSQWLPIQHAIEAVPAADVRPAVKARWKPVMCADNPNIQDRDEWYGLLFVCDKCNWTMIGESNFCPNCGARMEEN
jgi:hypothetical protein